MRPILADAVDLARRALLELEPAAVGAHLGVSAEDDTAVTHRFEATLPGYRGWQWAVVVAAAPDAEYATVSESALLPGPDALVAPEFVPWDQRIRPGDLAPGDLLAPPPGDPRLVPGYVASGDPAVDEVAAEIGLGRTQVLSLEGREDAAERWYREYGPDTEMAKAAPSTCGLCGFYLPLAGSLRAAFGVCGNSMGADGHVVHTEYGCGAHSDVVAPSGNGSPLYEAYDDAAVEMIPADELRKPEPEPTTAADSAVTEPNTAATESGTGAVQPKTADAADPSVDAGDAGAVEVAAGADPQGAEDSDTAAVSTETVAAESGSDAAVSAPAVADTQAGGPENPTGASSEPVAESVTGAVVSEPAEVTGESTAEVARDRDASAAETVVAAGESGVVGAVEGGADSAAAGANRTASEVTGAAAQGVSGDTGPEFPSSQQS